MRKTLFQSRSLGQTRIIERFRFEEVRYNLHIYFGRGLGASGLGAGDPGQCGVDKLLDLFGAMEGGNTKFPAKCHRNTRWFDAQQFVMIQRDRDEYSISENMGNFLLSALSIAVQAAYGTAFPGEAGGGGENRCCGIDVYESGVRGVVSGTGMGGGGGDQALFASPREVSSPNMNKRRRTGSPSSPMGTAGGGPHTTDHTVAAQSTTGAPDALLARLSIPCFVCLSSAPVGDRQTEAGKTIGEACVTLPDGRRLRRRFVVSTKLARLVDPKLRELGGVLELWESLAGRDHGGGEGWMGEEEWQVGTAGGSGCFFGVVLILVPQFWKKMGHLLVGDSGKA